MTEFIELTAVKKRCQQGKFGRQEVRNVSMTARCIIACKDIVLMLEDESGGTLVCLSNGDDVLVTEHLSSINDKVYPPNQYWADGRPVSENDRIALLSSGWGNAENVTSFIESVIDGTYKNGLKD